MSRARRTVDLVDEDALRANARCDLPVTPAELEFEIQFARDKDNPGLDRFHVHIRCFERGSV